MVQVRTTGLPIRFVPHIGGVVVTQDQIKNTYSNHFVNDATTPLNFTMEYQAKDGTLETLAWNESLSQASSIYFAPPDSFYSAGEEWSVTVYWTISTEKIYLLKSVKISIADELKR